MIFTTGFTAAGLVLHQPISKAEAAAENGAVVVLGSNGFLGGDVVRSLLKKGIVTRAAARSRNFEIAKDTENLKLAQIAYADVRSLPHIRRIVSAPPLTSSFSAGDQA